MLDGSAGVLLVVLGGWDYDDRQVLPSSVGWWTRNGPENDAILLQRRAQWATGLRFRLSCLASSSAVALIVERFEGVQKDSLCAPALHGSQM